MYIVTDLKIKRNYQTLNITLFKSKLPSVSTIDFKLQDLSDNWGCCHFWDNHIEIILLPQYKNRWAFLNILAHEMTHVYTWIKNKDFKHSNTFFKFKPIFEKHGLILKEQYTSLDFKGKTTWQKTTETKKHNLIS